MKRFVQLVFILLLGISLLTLTGSRSLVMAGGETEDPPAADPCQQMIDDYYAAHPEREGVLTDQPLQNCADLFEVLGNFGPADICDTLYNEGCLDITQACLFIRGDVNQDNVVNWDDVSALYNVVYNYASPVCGDAADVNNDGYINNTDYNDLYGYLGYNYGNPPASPYPSAGEDLDSDSLSCNSCF